MGVVSKLKVWFGSDTKDLEKGFKKTKSEAESVSKTIGKIGSVIGVSFALGAIKSFANECRQLYAVQESAEKKLEAVHKATQGASELSTNQMKRFASQLQSVTTIGDEVTINAMAMLSTFKSIKGDVFKDAIKSAADMAEVMGTDLNAAVLQVGKALEAPEVGLTALRKSGVSFTTEQIAQIKKLVAEGKKQEAQLIILAELQSQFGGAAEAAANTATGAYTQFTNALGDQKEAIGKLVAPSTELYKSLTKIVEVNTALIQSDTIPWWKKLYGAIVGCLPWHRQWVASMKEQAVLEKDTAARNEDMVRSLELQYLAVGKLNDVRQELVDSQFRSGLDWSAAIAAIDAEIAKREQGIEAIDKEAEAKAKAAAEEKRLLDEKKAQVAEIGLLEEASTKSVNDKVKAYTDLLNATSFADQASRGFYEAEIRRLNELIAKEKERANARYFAANPKMAAMGNATSITGGLDDLSIGGGFELDLFGDTSMQALELKTIMVELIDVNAKVADSFMDVSAIATDALGGMATGISEAVGVMIAGQGDMNGFATLVAGTFADMAINVGKTAIQTGVAVLGIKAALKSLNPYAAIAAGVALVALGTAVKASLSNIGNGGGGTFSGNYGNNVDTRITPVGGTSDYEQKEVSVKVTGKLESRGNTLVAVIDSENERKRLTT